MTRAFHQSTIDIDDAEFYKFARSNYLHSELEAEFVSDLERFDSFKRALTREMNNTAGPLNQRSLVNHLIILFNTFDEHALKAMLYHKIDMVLHSRIRALIEILGYNRPGDIFSKTIYSPADREFLDKNDIHYDRNVI